MQTITTTQLRTKSKTLVKVLQEGRSVALIHRSKIVAEISPKIEDPKPFNPDDFRKALEKLKLPQISNQELEKNYREAMNAKYGPDIS